MTFIMFGAFKYVLVLTADSENPNNCTATGTIFSITGDTKLHLDSTEVFNSPEASFEDRWNALPDEDPFYVLLIQNEAEPYLMAAKRCKFPGVNGERAILTKEVSRLGGTNSIITESGKMYSMGIMPDLGYSSSDGNVSYGEDITKYIDIQLSELSTGESWRMDSLKVGVYDVHWSNLHSTYFLQNTVFDLRSRTFSNFTAETSDIRIKNTLSSFNHNIYKFLTNFSYTNNNDITFEFSDISLRVIQVYLGSDGDSNPQATLVFKDFVNGKTGIMVVTEETTTLTVSSDNA